jgi:menaquinone-dependent protoporphyrinogen oxidase
MRKLASIQPGDKMMNDKILVTYASKAGSTAAVAEAIGRSLAEGGARVDVRPMQEVSDLPPYRAVVAGSAIRGAKWLPEAMQFVQTHRAELSAMPFAAFLVCITLSMKDASKYRPGVAEWMQPVREMVRPVSEGLFAGALDFSKLPLSPRVLLLRVPVLLGLWKEGDHQDWGAIREWAQGLLPLLV